MQPRFVMFYADGSIVEDDGEDIEVTFKVPRVWLDAPKDGLQSIVRHRADSKLVVLDSHDQYAVLPNGEPMATNDLAALLRSVGIAKSGLQIPDEEWAANTERVRAYRKQWERRGK